MPPPERPDIIQIAYDDYRLVANSGLILPVTLAHHLGLAARPGISWRPPGWEGADS